jgi:hypothetical protein
MINSTRRAGRPVMGHVLACLAVMAVMASAAPAIAAPDQ